VLTLNHEDNASPEDTCMIHSNIICYYHRLKTHSIAFLLLNMILNLVSPDSYTCI
jgi:hypothetical protein